MHLFSQAKMMKRYYDVDGGGRKASADSDRPPITASTDLSMPMIQPKGKLAELCSGMNALGQQLQLNLNMSRTDKQKNLVIILYSHSLTLFQEQLTCVNDARLPEFQRLLLQLLEASVATAAACGQRQLIDDFYEVGDRQRIYHLKAYQSLPRDVGGKISKLSGRYFAKIAGLSDYYDELRRHVDMDAVPVPECHQLSIVSCECMFLVMKSVTDFFRLEELDREYYLYWQQFLQLARGK